MAKTGRGTVWTPAETETARLLASEALAKGEALPIAAIMTAINRSHDAVRDALCKLGIRNPRYGYWTPQRTAKLVNEWHAGTEVTVIADKFGRSRDTIMDRLRLLRREGMIECRPDQVSAEAKARMLAGIERSKEARADVPTDGDRRFAAAIGEMVFDDFDSIVEMPRYHQRLRVLGEDTQSRVGSCGEMCANA